MKSEDQLLKVEEVAEKLKVSRRQVYRLLQDRAFPKPLKLHGARRWLASEIMAYLEMLAGKRPQSEGVV